jgi:hypothetical protein
VYNIICDSLCLTPNPNNGTLRLPLKPVGLHSPETAASDPLDPVDPTATTDPGTDAISISPIEASSAADPSEVPPSFVGVDPVDGGEKPPVEDDDKGKGADEEEKDGFWDYLYGKLEGFKEWIAGLADSGNDSG